MFREISGGWHYAPDGAGGETAGAPAEPGGGSEAGGVKTFSQADVDRIVGERLSRERTRYADYDDLRAKAAAHDAGEAAKLSEIEKANRRAAEAEARVAATRAAVTRAHVLATAARLGVVDPEAAYKLLDAGKLTVGEDGEPTNGEEALGALLKEKPYLRGQLATSSPTNPARGHEAEDAFTAALYRGAGLRRGG